MANTLPPSIFSFSICVVHPVDFFLNFLDHHRRLLLEGELLVEEYLPTWIHISILTYSKFRKATKRKVSPFLHEVSIKGTKVPLDSIAAFKESQTFLSQLSLEIGEFDHPFSFFSKTYTMHIPYVLHHCNHLTATIWDQVRSITFHPSIHNQPCSQTQSHSFGAHLLLPQVHKLVLGSPVTPNFSVFEILNFGGNAMGVLKLMPSML